MAHVLKGSHSFTCTPRVHPLTEWTIPAFAFPAEAGTYLPTPEGWKAELALVWCGIKVLSLLLYLVGNYTCFKHLLQADNFFIFRRHMSVFVPSFFITDSSTRAQSTRILCSCNPAVVSQRRPTTILPMLRRVVASVVVMFVTRFFSVYASLTSGPCCNI